MGFVGDLLGGGDDGDTKVVEASTVPIERFPPATLDIQAALSSLGLRPTGDNAFDLNLLLNPQIGRTLNTFGLQSSDLFNEFTTLGDQLSGNLSPFVAARVSPFEQALAQSRASQQADLNRRNIFGGLQSNLIGQFDALGERELSAQRALATQEGLTAMFQALGGAANVNTQQLQLAQALLAQELGALGISLDAIQLAIGSQLPTTQVAGGTTTETVGGSSFGDTLTGVGSLLTGIGAFT